MDFLLAFALTGLVASSGWIVWGLSRGWARTRDRRHQVRLARARSAAELRQAEVRKIELDNETYQDFVRRHPES
ncbi:hypothetical protein F8271_05980 [Micromonospora sp. ALFpr18c]|uniref:hypothetical protein n=1 Tax=unclassified Micromonospora TaxID=2617518 RepID=UPI00124B879B|nr:MULTISPECIES: hypothetical protein [unclassified Micromonospora]KAB1946728.1 hypothetical protein F8271_05980 [Micromonospora sp. ALFpr18c]MDG4757448.1 hypothetical protein [Micromonospora sp. WMMD710]